MNPLWRNKRNRTIGQRQHATIAIHLLSLPLSSFIQKNKNRPAPPYQATPERVDLNALLRSSLSWPPGTPRTNNQHDNTPPQQTQPMMKLTTTMMQLPTKTMPMSTNTENTAKICGSTANVDDIKDNFPLLMLTMMKPMAMMTTKTKKTVLLPYPTPLPLPPTTQHH